MRGALVFLAVFAVFFVVTFGYPTFPFGSQIYYAVGGVNVNYPILGIPVTTLAPAVFNGVVYGFIVWLIFSMVSTATGKGKTSQSIQQNVTVKVDDAEKDVKKDVDETNTGTDTSKATKTDETKT